MLLEDEEAFQAALSFVDEFSFEEGRSEAPQAVEKAPKLQAVDVASSPRLESKRRRLEANERKKLLRRAGVYADSNRARNARTKEIAALRAQLEQLQIDLQTLKSRKTQARQRPQGERDRAWMLSAPSFWRDVAERQQQRRTAAERDNVQLRLALERQRKVSDSLKKLVHKRTNELASECASLSSLGCGQHDIANVFAYHGDMNEFQGLFRQLDAAYREIDAVFEANNQANVRVSPNDVHMREGAGGKGFEFFTSKTLPFRVQDTTEAAWNHFKGVEKHMGYSSLYEKAAKDLDEPYTIVEDFTKEVYSNNARADVRMKQIVRRYVEADRDIVIWVARAVPIQIKHRLFLGMAYLFRGYAITKHSDASTPDHELSELHLSSLISLDLDPHTQYDPDTLRALTHFLVIHGAKDILAHRELIENALVDRSLRICSNM